MTTSYDTKMIDIYKITKLLIGVFWKLFGDKVPIDEFVHENIAIGVSHILIVQVVGMLPDVHRE